MSTPRIRQIQASVVRGGGADYHDQDAGHWIDDHVSTPMGKYPEYRRSRQSFGINVLGTLVVEIEADDGTTGFAVTTGGELGAWIIERHLARFIEGQLVTDIEKIWDQMYLSTLYYGRKGIVLNTSSPTPPERVLISPRRWGSSAARCRCSTGRRSARRG